MDLHHYTPQPITQADTLLRQLEAMLRSLERLHASIADQDVHDACGLQTQHLRNSVALLGRMAQGYAGATDLMLRTAAIMVDEGLLPAAPADDLLDSARAHLGDAYVSAAQAAALGN